MSEAAHGLGWGLQGRRRGHGTRRKRAGTHSAPHVHLLWPTWRPRMGRSSVDIAAPRALTVRRATCERPRSPRPPLCIIARAAFHGLAFECYPYRDAAEINN